MIPQYLTETNIDEIPQYETDVLVIGGGIAGLYTAIKACETNRVLMVMKKSIWDSNSRFAQGGIAAVMGEEDSLAAHIADTLNAGAGLCSPESVRILVEESPELVDELIGMGTQFDREQGRIALTREGGHSQRRILHANGDASGLEIVRALSAKVEELPNVTIWAEHFVIDLLTADEVCFGALVQHPDGRKTVVKANATILCTGGVGQLYQHTTNPDIATGDGVAIAYRAGADVRGLEFVQFHPTAFCHPGAPSYLLTEALRGEGAILRNIDGVRFMQDVHPLQDLAPRDIVARAIVREMERTKQPFVYVDSTHLASDSLQRRFPNIYDFCKQYGFDLASDWIPVAPAAHYMMGGVKTGLHGETNIQRLYACGEVASTGVHGANRLASNSLSEALVFGQRIVTAIQELAPLPERQLSSEGERYTDSVFSLNQMQATVHDHIEEIRRLMTQHVGITRTASGLQYCYEQLWGKVELLKSSLSNKIEYEFANMLTCSLLITEAALLREESRGGHYREDFPEADDSEWRHHIVWNRNKSPIREWI